jgi:hypothetical protein
MAALAPDAGGAVEHPAMRPITARAIVARAARENEIFFSINQFLSN